MRLEKCVVALRNSCRVAEGAEGREGARGEGGGGDNAEPGETDPEEHGVDPPQYVLGKDRIVYSVWDHRQVQLSS